MDLHTVINLYRCKTRIDYSQLSNSRIHGSFLAQLDKSRIAQVVYNLLDNAFKFATDGDTIRIILDVEFTNDQKCAVISIMDSGKGIDMEILPKLFTKFTTKSEKGIGLGLYITKSIIEAHSGRIWVKNNVNGTGATFSFTLPYNP
ncbi:MAG: ATP-binding protein [Candidatus Nitrosocosmicus sp.]|nr:ATP-binding protein [Candidatus Nitrosocosmicus sp.]MDN5867597.1 ATP-binding protein [Candidatus Nitrosocosmicus sp.]